MKRYIFKIFLFLSPLLLVSVIINIADPFKIWFSYDNYYQDYYNEINRGHVCCELYNKNKDTVNYNSFIFGSSRSQAYKTSDWKKHLTSSAIPFHFDASLEGIYGILAKLKYLDNLNESINNVLIILDEDCMNRNSNSKEHIFITPPTLSNESKFTYYSTFFWSSLDLKFMCAYFDYRITKKYKDYMSFMVKSNLNPIGNNVNGDIWYSGWDNSILNDSIFYYSNLIARGVFYNRTTKNNILIYPQMSDIEKEQLQEIALILKKNKTNYKIVISPLYDQIPISEERLSFLDNLFDKEKVYNFSGKNEFTESIGNYYESSHYRPHVAKK